MTLDTLKRLYQCLHYGTIPAKLTDWDTAVQGHPSAFLIRLGPEGQGLETVATVLAAREPEEGACP